MPARRHGARACAGIAIILIALALHPGSAAASPGSVVRASMSSAGEQGIRHAGVGTTSAVVSDDGRFVAFRSSADNLVSNDTNLAPDIFVRDRRTGTTERVSVSSAGAQADRASGAPAISADGRFVAFVSFASNLIDHEPNGRGGVFVRDRLTGMTERVDVSTAGQTANAWAWELDMSPDGRFVAFTSDASNLVAGDSNRTTDVFVRDRRSGTTERVSVGASDTQANTYSGEPAISADGRIIAFSSPSSNLVSGDTNDVRDVFVRDRERATTERVSFPPEEVGGGLLGGVVSAARQQRPRFSPAISGDGRHVAYAVAKYAGSREDAFVYDRDARTTEAVESPESGDALVDRTIALSHEGRYVAFASATDDYGRWEVFVRDRRTGTTEPVSVGRGDAVPDDSSYASAISADGRFVAFVSVASNLVDGDTNGGCCPPGGWDGFVRDREAGATERVSVSSAGEQASERQPDAASFSARMSADGQVVAFVSGAPNLAAGDSGSDWDVFVRDHNTGTTERISAYSGDDRWHDSNSQPAISADGRFVAFTSYTGSFVQQDDTSWMPDVFVRDRATGAVERVSVSSSGGQASEGGMEAAISADGRFVAFMGGSGLVAGDTNGTSDVFVRDRVAGTTARVSVRSDGGQANGTSHSAAISAGGRFIAFTSRASNLVDGDTNGHADVFVHDRTTGTTQRVSVATDGVQTNADSFDPSISADGDVVAFSSPASNLVEGDTNGRSDVFVRDLATATTMRVSIATAGEQAAGASQAPALSADGDVVAFDSDASNLVDGDRNGARDVFLHDRRTGVTTRESVGAEGAEPDGSSARPALSADGRTVAFESDAAGLVDGDTNLAKDVFVHGHPAADLSVAQSDAPDPILAGQTLTYEITVRNQGPAAATHVTLTDRLPAAVAYESATASQGSCDEDGAVVSCSVGRLAPGESETVAVEVTPQRGGTIVNEVTVNAREHDPRSDDNVVREETTVLPATDIAVRQSASPDPVRVGQRLTYTVTVTNDGPLPAQGVSLVDEPPAETTLVSAETSQGSCARGKALVTCSLRDLLVGAAATVTIVVRPRQRGTLVNTARASATKPSDDPDPADNSSTATATATS